MWNSARGTAILRLHVQCKSALPNHASHYTGDISEGLLSRSLPELLCNEITLKLNLLNRMSAGNSPGDISTCVFYVDVIYCILICCVFTINCSDRNLSRTFFLHSCLLFYFFFGMVSHCLSWHKHVVWSACKHLPFWETRSLKTPTFLCPNPPFLCHS